MIDAILEAIKHASPGIAEGDKHQARPAWVDKLTADTEFWLRGLTAVRVEVAVARNADWDPETLTVSVLTKENVVAQGQIAIEPGRTDGRGRFTGWELVRLGTITGLNVERRRVGHLDLAQITATFGPLASPLAIPADIEDAVPIEELAAIFEKLRDAWIDSGASEAFSSARRESVGGHDSLPAT